MSNAYENKIEEYPVERYNEQNKVCVENKLKQIALAFHDRPEVTERVAAIQKEIAKIQPQQFAADSHFAHVLGQLNGELGFVPRLAKHKERGDLAKAEKCEKIVSQTEDSVITFMDLCLKKEKDFFYGELSSRDGYWEERTINQQGKKIQQLNADEFIQLSAELLEEKETAQKA